MRKLIFSLTLAVTGFAASGQQDPQFTQYMFDRLSINPGFAGIDGKICATAIYRQQWAGFGGQPQTILFNAHAPIRAIHGGLGATIYSDKLGFQSNFIGRLSYSFHQPIQNVGVLGIGLSAGMVSVGYNATWIAIDNPTNDAAIPAASSSQATYDLGFGAYLSGRTYYVGLSATHLTESELTNINLANKRHYFVMAGYDWTIPGTSWAVLPSTRIESDAASTQVDVSVRGMWNNMVWAGVGYRIKDAISPMLGGQFTIPDKSGKNTDKGTVRIGYSYDLTTSEIKNYSNGSHEIFVNYCFTIVSVPKIEKSKTVRFL